VSCRLLSWRQQFECELPKRLILEPAGSGLQIRLPAQPLPPVGGTQFKLTLESSSDLKNWSPQGQLESSGDSVPQLTLTPAASEQFYRLRSEIEDTGVDPDGADLFGYNRIFATELQAAGFLKPEEFAATNQPSSDYLSTLSFDPTTAKFWDAFAADPAITKGLYDFRLTDTELGLFKSNGFVVSERLGSFSFCRCLLSSLEPRFCRCLYLPMRFCTAWHFTYERLLEESEGDPTRAGFAANPRRYAQATGRCPGNRAQWAVAGQREGCGFLPDRRTFAFVGPAGPNALRE